MHFTKNLLHKLFGGKATGKNFELSQQSKPFLEKCPIFLELIKTCKRKLTLPLNFQYLFTFF